MLPSPERVEMLLAVIASIAVRSRLTAGARWIRTNGPWRIRSAVGHIEVNCVGSVETRCRGFSAPARRPAFRWLTKRPYRHVSLIQLQCD